MTYLLNLQRAIAQTFKPCPYGVPDDYFLGWDEAGVDLEYGIYCGSEQAVKSQMTPWLITEGNQHYESLDSESDKGYCDRIKVIQLLMEKQNES